MYLDHNAGGRVRPEVAAVLTDWLRAPSANPSSLHQAGRRARVAMEEAREHVARLVGARSSEVVFTSGGTEANNLALTGAVPDGGHVVTTAIEHASVVASVEALGRRGVRSTLLPPSAEGRVTPSQVVSALEDDTALVSVGWANGEIGSIQPMAEIVAAVRSVAPGVRLHSDAVQAVSQLDVDAERVGLDLLSLSAHKLGAPAGVGGLVVRRETPLRPLLAGGPQERERRAGTENVAGIVAFGAAARLAREERAAYAARAREQVGILWGALAAALSPIERFGSEGGLPGTLAIGFPDLRGDALAAALDLRGVAVSTGSACAASAPEPSHVLRALGCSEALALGGLRLSLGPELRAESVREAARVVIEVVQAARGRRARRSADGSSHAA